MRDSRLSIEWDDDLPKEHARKVAAEKVLNEEYGPTVEPITILLRLDSDGVRVLEAFMGELDQKKPWADDVRKTLENAHLLAPAND